MWNHHYVNNKRPPFGIRICLNVNFVRVVEFISDLLLILHQIRTTNKRLKKRANYLVLLTLVFENRVKFESFQRFILHLIQIKVLYISDGCCTEFNIYYFILYLF